MPDYASEMRLFDPASGQRLYMDAQERERFLQHANDLPSRPHRLFCHLLHWTGARITEALALTADRIHIERHSITLRTLKKNKYTRQGELKAPTYREVPVPAELIDALDLLFDLRGMHRRRCASLRLPLWPHQQDLKRVMPIYVL
ncbi:MAG: tyrosine-type recombinase/integrase [Gammaproteobacteria bacterium]|nr:tyrosine-type recombinase/integrase [Gammaproteobacteria bacterium]